MTDFTKLEQLANLIRYYILISTTAAGSGHPTSSLSATELMTTLFFGGFLKCDLEHFDNPYNDRVIFSKGHASPLLYALYAAAGKITKNELLKLRTFDSPLEGHPSMRFKYTEASTGSLGQGLSIGFGRALALKHQGITQARIYVLLGDSETAEGQIWEAAELASFYKLNNLVAIVDVNRLGQRGETMLGWNLGAYQKRFESFGWHAVVVEDGNNIPQVYAAYQKIQKLTAPTVIIAKTVKGNHIGTTANKDGWHGKTLNKEQSKIALEDLGAVDQNVRGEITKPTGNSQKSAVKKNNKTYKVVYKTEEAVATREAYGDGLVALGGKYHRVVVLDAEVSNSTMSEKFKNVYPERFFEMYIAEQNMIGAGIGFSCAGYVPFISSFAAFLTRAFDQLRMAQYSEANLKIVGSHCGVSIGSDGPSQMGLEDIAMFRSIHNGVVLYPSDATCALALVEHMYAHKGISYLRTTREKTPVLYDSQESFIIGGSKIWFEEADNKTVVVAAGITLHEALHAREELLKKGISVAVVDLYSIKPLDRETVMRLAIKTKKVVTVEDHYMYGGIGEAVNSVLKGLDVQIINLAVTKTPRSGTPRELLRYEEIDSTAIVKAVTSLV